MDRSSALFHLHHAYGRALRLRDGGLTDREIAEVLGVEPEAIEPLMELAEAKLARVLRAPQRWSTQAVFEPTS
jgi:DNA-directed RNA polymerase specialized sigma24 family protein